MKLNKINFISQGMNEILSSNILKQQFRNKGPFEVLSQRILIVEDEVKISEHLVHALNDEGYSTTTCSTYKQLEELIQQSNVDFEVVILDRLLQGNDSANLIELFKEKSPLAQILVLSAIGSASEKVSVLDRGADDYLSKPFDTEELIARVRVLLRRKNTGLKIGNVVLDVEARTLRVGETELSLTNKEFALLKTLIQIPGKVFSKAALTEKVWEMNADIDSNVVEATMNKLRHRLKDSGANIQIRNARNLGYWIEE